jgi:D-alanyl-D-alanine dipeptidase
MDIQTKLIDISHLSLERCSKPIQVILRYATDDNFTGQRVAGYHAQIKHRGLLTHQAALSLCQAQEYTLINYGCTLLVYDAYRPLRAAKSFIAWSKVPESSPQDFELKQIYYPDLSKDELLSLGYLAPDISAHCYGNTIDLVLADCETLEPLDMGTCFDHFGPRSHPDFSQEHIGTFAFRNRQILRTIMLRFGFIPSDIEYWHFEFAQREITTPMDFEIL